MSGAASTLAAHLARRSLSSTGLSKQPRFLPSNALGLIVLALVFGSAQAATGATNACTATSPEEFIAAFAGVDAAVSEVKVASRSRFIAIDRPANLLVYPPREKAAAADTAAAPRLTYRIVVYDIASKTPLSLLSRDDVSAEAATQGVLGTDFRKDESKEQKTLLSFTPRLPEAHGYEGPPWKSTRLLVVGCDPAAAGAPVVRGVLELPRSSVGWSRTLAILLCVACYLFAATGTYFVHRRQRADPGEIDPLQPKTGTNYAGWFKHLNPVVLTAGSNGLGSATKLQILFFSLLVFGVVAFIWILTDHLTEMSSTVLLLMGISGIGAMAATGTEVTRNRLDFENWAWLVNSKWLPKGGVAEENMAKWKDIVTTGGEFDATRFQMITFSLLVGGALLTAGSQLMDLSGFDIPSTLLGILGLSQVVYVGGKLTAPPAISDLNAQILKLRKAETDMSTALSKVNTGSLDHATIPMVDDPDVQATRAAYSDYLAHWATSKTMFEATLGRLVPHWAHELRPPEIPELVMPTPNALPDAARNVAYTQDLAASGGAAPYTWTLIKGRLPQNLTISAQGRIGGTPTVPGASPFTLRVADASNVSNSRTFSIMVK